MGPKCHLHFRASDEGFEVIHATADMWHHAELGFLIWSFLVLAPPTLLLVMFLTMWYFERKPNAFRTVAFRSQR